MIEFPQIDPVALELGPIKLRWYGLMYMLGFCSAWLLGRYRASRPGSSWQPREVDDVVALCMIGLIIGARIGYFMFYDLTYFLNNPLDILMIWKGGMSFHGGLAGVVLCLWIFAKRTGRSLFEVSDFFVPLCAPGLFFGRIGNFINGELWGRVTDVPWAMIFPDPLAEGKPRHPSQLYEAFLEGLVLFIIVWWYSAKPKPAGAVSGVFLIGYGVFRFLVEFVREPDIKKPFVAFGWVTMGQVLCLPMILGGLFLLYWAFKVAGKSAKAPRP
jgi:phosphatidylglycerol:prolipoprotein diacylglycerol transferase